MTTTIPTRYSTRGDSAAIYRCGPDRVDFGITQAGENERAVAMDRAEFLAAVEAELGVLIINRDDLPAIWYGDVDSATPDVNADGGYGWPSVSEVPPTEYALAIIAANEHLAANPPVDKAQVNALAKILAADDHQPHASDSYIDTARRLVRAGVRAPEEAGR